MPTSFFWPSAPATPSTPSSSDTLSTSHAVAGTVKRGLLRPFRRNSINGLATGSGAELRKSRLGQLLGTRCASTSSTGELPWRGSFGSLIQTVRHRANDAVTAELVRQHALTAVARWMPNLRITKVLLERRKDSQGLPTILVARISYEELEKNSLQVVPGSADALEVPLGSGG